MGVVTELGSLHGSHVVVCQPTTTTSIQIPPPPASRISVHRPRRATPLEVLRTACTRGVMLGMEGGGMLHMMVTQLIAKLHSQIMVGVRTDASSLNVHSHFLIYRHKYLLNQLGFMFSKYFLVKTEYRLQLSSVLMF